MIKKLLNRLTGKAVKQNVFVEYMGQAAKDRYPHWKVMISTDHALIRIDNGSQTLEVTMNKAYQLYLAAPDDLNEVASDLLKQLEEAFPRAQCIVPIIKEKSWLDIVRQQLSQRESNSEVLEASLDFAYEVYNDELIVLFAEDGNDTMRFLVRSEMQTDLEPAVHNLQQILPEVSATLLTIEHSDAKVATMNAGGTYESSLLLINDYWVDNPDPGLGELLVSIPSRGTLFFTHSNQTANVEALRRVTEQHYREDDRPITPWIFTRRNGTFQPWEKVVV